jgi:hypothetical protein
VEFRAPLVLRLMTAVGVAVLGLTTAFMTAVAVALLFGPAWPLGLLVVAPVACFLGALTGYVARDFRGRWGLRVVLDTESVRLELPGGRSLIHRPPAQRLEIPYRDIETVETRLEAYTTLGMAILQRVFVLRRKNGNLIFLFEDRAIGTALKVPFCSEIAAAIAGRADVYVKDLGMVEGRGGVLAVWGTHAPDWAAPPLSGAQQLRVWRHAAFTGSLAIAMVIFAIVVRLISGPLF